MHFSSQMPVQCEIFPVLTQSRITAPISSFLRLIEGVHSPLPDFQKALSSCYVTDISQYRCNKTAHEVVIVRMKYSGVDVDAPDTHTTRYYRFDRFREQSRQREPDNGFSKLIEQTVEGSISSLKSYQRHDQVKVSDELINDALGVLSTKYDLVREFGVKQGTMSILEALVIADTISELSQHYTIFVHMCHSGRPTSSSFSK
ncbi:hypothetical protein BKA62DRAFT_771161 [Auriculariales sp. MPI-PUGE-AT-0066]|nr:hypothetical protein BKA62DRAFT_771161 [Auriculariales sp. MPI-PUGE-AT-0066]